MRDLKSHAHASCMHVIWIHLGHFFIYSAHESTYLEAGAEPETYFFFMLRGQQCKVFKYFSGYLPRLGRGFSNYASTDVNAQHTRTLISTNISERLCRYISRLMKSSYASRRRWECRLPLQYKTFLASIKIVRNILCGWVMNACEKSLDKLLIGCLPPRLLRDGESRCLGIYTKIHLSEHSPDSCSANSVRAWTGSWLMMSLFEKGKHLFQML
jgi:hypothetical protein